MKMNERENILGVMVSPINMQDALANIKMWINNKSPNYVCVTPIHGVMDCLNSPELKLIFNKSGMTTPDGMGIVWLLKMRGRKNVTRVYGPDIMMKVCELGLENNWRHYFYGSSNKVVEQLIEKLQLKFSGLIVAGSFSPPFRELSVTEEEEIISEITAAQPDIVWVGLSTPKQERWMNKYLEVLNVPVLVGVGAAFDFISGNKKQAPAWIQKSGLEWLFRLLSEPGRLWKRYIKYPLFFGHYFLQITGLRSYNTIED